MSSLPVVIVPVSSSFVMEETGMDLMLRIVTSSDAHRPEDVGDNIGALEARVIECQKSTKEVSP